ncbi:MAG TPA: ATP-grasp domain-containing protein [Acidimicrobiales bacterium]
MQPAPDVQTAGAPAGSSGRVAIGIVGAGQLAKMTVQAAATLGLRTAVLAEARTDPAAEAATRVIHGSPEALPPMLELAAASAVITFDHEQVDLDVVREVEAQGHHVRPGSETLTVTVDKGVMRRRFADAGIAVPGFALLGDRGDRGEPDGRGDQGGRAAGGEQDAGDGQAPGRRILAQFAAEHPGPLVLKALQGGYDGRGVWFAEDLAAAEELAASAARHGTALLVEEAVPIAAELAVMVARRPDGSSVVWPAVRTVQVDGICREVVVPTGLPADVEAEAAAVALNVAGELGTLGVLAVELFWSDGRLLVNEVAARPHNSGHWTIEGSTTSQFENHLRAILDLPLGDPSPTAEHVVTVNVLGGPEGVDPASRLAGALEVRGAHVHLYGKAARPGRKLGHVTVCGTEADDVRRRAWDAAIALGTPAFAPVVPGTT